MASKENNGALDTCELGLTKSLSQCSQNTHVFKDELKAEETAEGQDNTPIEKHCENLWVEVESREVKPSISIVADHLNEKFEELLQPLSIEKKAGAESASAGENLNNQDIEARSTDHLSTYTQSESEPKESAHRSLREDVLHVQENSASLSSCHQDPGEVSEEEHWTPSSHYTREEKDDGMSEASEVTKTHLDVNWKHNIASTDKTTRSQENIVQSDFEECTRSRTPVLNRNPTSVSRISDEELEEDVERFKQEVGKLKAAFRDREKEKSLLQKEVEDGCVDCLSLCVTLLYPIQLLLFF